jgi:HSP20 family protein
VSPSPLAMRVSIAWACSLARWWKTQAVHVETELPGVTADQVEIDADRETLVIRATRSSSPQTETAPDGTETTDKRSIVRTERSYGRLERRLALPVAINPDDVTAELKDGVLTVRLPRAEANGRKRIEVKSN